MNPYPLQWPAGRRRCADPTSPRTRYSIARTIPPLLDELEKLGAVRVTITSYARLKPNGLPYSDGEQSRNIPDPGVAVWFCLNQSTLLYCLSCDQTDTIGGNLREIGLAVAELRGFFRRLGTPLPVVLTGFAAEPTMQPLPRIGVLRGSKANQPTTPEPGRAPTAPNWQVALGVAGKRNLTWKDSLAAYQTKFRQAETQEERDKLVAAQTEAARFFGKDIR